MDAHVDTGINVAASVKRVKDDTVSTFLRAFNNDRIVNFLFSYQLRMIACTKQTDFGDEDCGLAGCFQGVYHDIVTHCPAH